MGNKKGTNNSKPKKNSSQSTQTEKSFLNEIIIILLFGLCVFLLLSCFGIGGTLGGMLSYVLFGLFGVAAYIFPIILFIGITFLISNKNNKIALIKFIAGALLYLAICNFAHMISGVFAAEKSIIACFTDSAALHTGGGFIGGILSKLLYPLVGKVGIYIIIALITLTSIVLITEKSLLKGLKSGSKKIYESAKNDSINRREKQKRAREEKNNHPYDADQELFKVVENDEKPKPRMHSGVGVTFDTKIVREEKQSDTMRELSDSNIVIEDLPNNSVTVEDFEDEFDLSDVVFEPQSINVDDIEVENIEVDNIDFESNYDSKITTESVEAKLDSFSPNPIEEIKKYTFPPYKLLKSGNPKDKGDSKEHLNEMADKLLFTLKNFGVDVKITDISCGPTVTRYELAPEVGVKVSKIVNLADDIKLSLAATDIRIEAPIPGKSAIGIEVPNKTNISVMLRDILESTEFKNTKSKLSFCVGKDIGGKPIVADIAKMPHLLIAGATGSGKSVCINTIIMSILYNATPDEVKMIMIDPKVVELSVYNGIPHLMIPVVTDPKKAAGALQWGVNEMLDRYQKFADLSVRDLEHYNIKIREARSANPDSQLEVLPQLLIIVDELADLMMAAPGEVEDSICRLAQLARAAGIHLVIATQRPSVNVITGLIKANMPSRLAFAVSSGVDSRTILDMSGAEKLLGKGDMLFYPQGMPKPVRIQGAFVSENEVSDVVKYLSEQNKITIYNSEIEERINNTPINSTVKPAESEHDAYFIEAGKYIIEKDKASIGMLQRVFKIGFNRAARIMDQLALAGVVGEEEGTKPRKILMTMDEFLRYIDEEY